MGLIPRRQRFVTEYLVDLNASQAVLRAGYNPRTAPQQGSRLLKNVHVQAAIAAKQTQQLAAVRRAARRGRVQKSGVPRAAAQLLLALGDAGCPDAGYSGTGRTCRSVDDAALHASQSRCDRRSDSPPRSALTRSQPWRYCGDGRALVRKCNSRSRLLVDRMGFEPVS